MTTTPAAQSSFLASMARSSRERVRTARAALAEGALLTRALAAPPAPPLRLQGFDVIAELKLRSPASGALATARFDLEAQLKAYAAGGAAAVSILTEPAQFKGELAHLERASALLRPAGIPAMRKDFLTEPYQVIEARAAGAGGVLVIVTMLDDTEVQALLECADELGLFVLLEAFDTRDLERIGALAVEPAAERVLVGVNCRDLKTLDVRFERFAELAPDLPTGRRIVAESGIGAPSDVERVVGLGYRLVLAGSALMQAQHPETELREWLTVGRRAATSAERTQCS